MKQFFLMLFSFFITISLFAQERLIPDKQFMLGCVDVGPTEQVTHYINAEGQRWQYSSGSFVTGGITSSSLVTTGNADFNGDWPGFNFSWFYSGPYWSLGLYKVTNSKQTDKYFYIDSRDSDFGSAAYNPDFYIYFDNGDNIYKHRFTDEEISQGEIVRVWDIHSESPNTSGLQNYWSNVLVILTDQINPLVVWGPHPTFSATQYKVYRTVSSTPLTHPEIYASLIATVSGITYEYKDTDISLNGNDYVYYFVKGYNGSYSGSTNIGYVQGGIYKKGLQSNEVQELTYTLSQNYPNPFNPTTTISYSIPKASYVTLKVYDMLGNEINNLVREVKDAGSYSVSFNASHLASGIYFYKLQAGNYSVTKKMLLTK